MTEGAGSIGTARIDVVVDASTADGQIVSFKRSVAGMSAAAQAEFNKLDAATKRYATSLIKQADTIGLTRDQQIAYNAQMRIGGALATEIAQKATAQAAAQKELASAQERSSAAAAEAARRLDQEAAARERNWVAVRKTLADEDRIRKNRADALAAFGPELAARERLVAASQREAGVHQRLDALLRTERGQRILAAQATTQHATALGRATIEFNKYGVSAKQNAAALRGVPAQLTDIFTSLASGQRPFTVLLQQGGQLKDMFGGIVPAARALGGAIAGLVNPLTLTAAAVVALGLAWKSAADEQANFEKALILTGNQADLTSKQLRGMASSLDDSTNVTTAKASEVLAQVAATGKFTADQIGLVAEAAINLEDATGRSIEQTVREFAELRKDPVEAIKRLNEAMGDGTNVVQFLTPEIRKSIEALKDQGDEAGAAALAIDAYAGAINDAAPQVVDHLSAWSKLWRDIKFGVGEATDSVKEFFRESTASTIAAQSFRNLLPFRADEPTAQPRAGRRTGPVPNTIFDDKFQIPGVPSKTQFSVVPLSVDFTPKARPASGGGGGRSFGGGSSRSSVRELPDFSKQAAAELERLAAAEDRATESFLDLQAQLDGPMAVALRDHQKRVEELNALAAQSPEAAKNLSTALELEAQRHKAVTDELKAQQEPWNQTLAAMRSELDLIGAGNTERAVANDLMREGIELSSEFAKAKLEEARAIDQTADAQQKAIGFMDGFRQSAADSLGDFATQAKSAKDAALDFFDSVIEAAIRAASERAIQAIFGPQGSNGEGSSGGGWLAGLANLITGSGSSASSGDWFGFWKNGGAFANGAPVEYFARGDIFDRPTAFNTGRGMGVMGEAGPEAIMPLKRGPDGKLGVAVNDDAAPRRGDVIQHNTYNIAGPMSRTAREAARYDNARNLNRAQRRNG